MEDMAYIKTDKLLALADKAARLDAVARYIDNRDYVSLDVLKALLGVPEQGETEVTDG